MIISLHPEPVNDAVLDVNLKKKNLLYKNKNLFFSFKNQ
jgi:hypothetical protein